MPDYDSVRIGIVSVSDRASSGVYEDKGLPALKEWLGAALHNPITFNERLIPDEKEGISQTLIELVDAGCALVLTTEGQSLVPGIFAAVPYCIDLMGGPYLETRDEVCKAFRPKSAIRPPR